MIQLWKFDQGTHLPPSCGGVCMQLVAFWIDQMATDKKAVDVKAIEQLCQKEAQALQNFYDNVDRDAEGSAAKEAVSWFTRGLKIDPLYTNVTDTDAVCNFLDEKKIGYSFGIYFQSGGGHELGIWRSGRSEGFLSSYSGHVYFFDPNKGCYKGDLSDFRGWLDDFLQKEYQAVFGNISAMEIAKVRRREAVKFGVNMLAGKNK